MATSSDSASKDMIVHNPNQPDTFGYQIAFVKTSESGEESSYSATQFVSEFNIYESMFAKAMCLTVGVFDGAGLMETIALQPGDAIDVTLFKDENSKKIVKRFYIMRVGDVARVKNSQAKTYTLSAMTKPAFLNKKKTVYRGFKGKHSDMISTVCKDFLEIPDVEIESTSGEFNIASPGKTPFKIISQLMLHSISEEGGEDKSLYFFYEDRDGFKFKTLNKVITDANTHQYIVSIDKNIDGTTDLQKIQHFSQLKAGSQSERMDAGMYENEIVEFDPLTRKLNNVLWKFKEAGQSLQLLGQNPVVDTVNNIDQWVNEAETKVRGLSNMVKFRVDDEAYDMTNNYKRKFGAMVAQKAMFNQIIYAIQIFGTTNIKAGDILDITAPSFSMQGNAPELDFSLQGKFLVGDVRHRVVGGEQFITILNIFRDGYETEYTSKGQK